MIKEITLTLTLILSLISLSFGQEKFTYNQDGFNPKYLVVEIDSITKNELFKKSINWIKETYKNPDEVIKTTIDNEKVRIEGFRDNLFCVNSLGMKYCYYSLYTIEIEFKDNKYKFTPLHLEYRVPASQYSAGGMTSVNFSDGSTYYKNNGALRKMYETVPSSIANLFNDLNADLVNYLLSEKEINKTDDW